MTRRSHLTATIVALLVVGWMVAGAEPRGSVLAADPLSDAKAKQLQLANALSQQRAQLLHLKATAARLTSALANAKAQLASVSAQYEKVAQTLTTVTQDIVDTQAQLDQLNAQITALNAQLNQVAAEIVQQTAELTARQALLQDHLRAAYESSMTSLLEVLLAARNLDDATNQVGYLLSIGDQDKALADEIRSLRESLAIKQQQLLDGRATLNAARVQAEAEKKALDAKRAQLVELQARLAILKIQWEARKAQQEAALNAALGATGNVAQQIANNEAAAKAVAALVARLQEEARRASMVSADGFQWPESGYTITQYFGPTTFALEPPYTYNGVYYRHFHTGLDISSGCGTPIHAAGTGVVAASGQPLWPYDSAYGVIIDHGAGINTWYWHLQPRVVVRPGQTVQGGQLIGYEGSTGYSTGCHLHLAFNVNGVFRNPLAYLP
ncbi:MAG: peptidoglycan DD-metalloendopeptidase family protein [Chloroflexota bacterium]|nr:peptidoglycan DD-metalloendopeptidase family protein [Chloroflexota bacterium]